MDNDKMPTVEEEFLDALDVLWRQHGNDDPGYKAMLPFVKQIAELQAEANEQARLNGMGAEREARLMAQVAELQAERDALAKDAEMLQRSRAFYALRCDAMKEVQSKMRDPERKAVCDILANGNTSVFDDAVTEGDR